MKFHVKFSIQLKKNPVHVGFMTFSFKVYLIFYFNIVIKFTKLARYIILFSLLSIYVSLIYVM